MIVEHPGTVRIGGVEITVRSECSAENGCWRCLKCDVSFRNDYSAQQHEKIYWKHPIVWECAEHGMEVKKPLG